MSKTILLNQSDWHFTKENPGIPTAVMGEAIALPHTWNAVDGQDGGNDYYRGTCWYTLALAKPARRQGCFAAGRRSHDRRRLPER